MGTEDALQVYPTAEELSLISTKVKCPQKNCSAVFQSTSNLNMHLIKRHKVINSALTKKAKMQFFCPVELCPYFKNSKKHFSKLKYLKQHFLKVHALKEFICKKCDKKFSTKAYKSSHMKSCGKMFTCNCGLCYTSSEAILTHCRRKGKGHFLVGKSEKVKGTNYDINSLNINSEKKIERFIYPKPSGDMSFPIHYIAAIALSELSTPCNLSKLVDRGIQTDLTDFFNVKDSKMVNAIQKHDKKRKSSQHTQTIGKLKKLKISTQTQTNCDYLKHKNKNYIKAIPRKRKKSMETQTKDNIKYDNEFFVKSKLNSENNSNGWSDTIGVTKFEEIKHQAKSKNVSLHDERDLLDRSKEKKWLWDNQFFTQSDISESKADDTKSELFNMSNELTLYSKEINLNEYSHISDKNNKSPYASEQGSDNQMFDLNKLCNIETQTEIDAFLMEYNDDTTFTLCSTTETQTTNDFDSLLYSNMCTQTCDEVEQLFNFNFVNIETQTTWPELNDCHQIN